jgi:hypothetical protein
MAATSLHAQISPFGVCAHLGGDEFSDHEQELRLMQDAGIRWTRADFSWSYFEPANDEWRFERYDTIVAASKVYGVTLLPILCYNVDWAFPAHDHLDDWCDYVRIVVGRYKGDLKHWEVWNEPNVGFWKPEPNAEQYARLLIATYKAIKETDPEAQVVYGGTAGVPLDYIRKTFDAGAFDAFDVLAVHPYRYPTAPEESGIAEDLHKTWALLEEFGGGKRMWITEFGWPTHRNTAVGDGTFPANLIRYAAKRRFPHRTEFVARVLDEPGLPGRGAVGGIVKTALGKLDGFSAEFVDLAGLADLSPDTVQILVMPTGEHYPADYFDRMVDFVREGGLLVHLGGVPFYYAQRKDANGEWKGPHAPESARESLHAGWKAWWTQQGVPESAGTSRLAVEDSGIEMPGKVGSTRWLTDTKLKGNDQFIPLLAAYNGDQLVGYPVALYLYDSDLKGAFLSAILDVAERGVVERGVVEDVQGLYLPRAFLLALGEGVENIYWYEFRDGGNDPTYNEHRFGIIHRDNSVKPAYTSYRTLTRVLGKAQFVEKLDLGPGNFGYVFDAGGSRTVAVWRASGADRVRLVVTGGDIKVMDYHGAPLSATPAEGVLEITSSEKVTYVTGLETAQGMD